MVAEFTAPSRKLAYANPTLPPDRFCPCEDGIPDSAALNANVPERPLTFRLWAMSFLHSPPILYVWLSRTHVALSTAVGLSCQRKLPLAIPIEVPPAKFVIPPCEPLRPDIAGKPRPAAPTSPSCAVS